MPQKRAFTGAGIEYLKCSYWQYFNRNIQCTKNAPEYDIYSSTYRALEMTQEEPFTAAYIIHYECP
jgi:hypothetical protein